MSTDPFFRLTVACHCEERSDVAISCNFAIDCLNVN